MQQMMGYGIYLAAGNSAPSPIDTIKGSEAHAEKAAQDDQVLFLASVLRSWQKVRLPCAVILRGEG
jgi:hypothetical protein